MSVKRRKIENENRMYQSRWESDYLITMNKNKIQCLICMQVLSVCKEYNVKRHYTSLHSKTFDAYIGESRTAIIADYKKKLLHQTTFFSKLNTTETSSLAASYSVALELAKAKKPYTDGMIIKKCAIEMAKQFNEPSIAEKFKTVALSHQTVSRRVEHMDQYVSKKVSDLMEKCKYFSLCLDESTDSTDVSQLLIFVRIIQEDFTVNEELLSLESLHGNTQGIDIFKAVHNSVEKYGGFKKCSCIVTDGAKAMTGTQTGFCGLLKQNDINCPTIHCIIHQEALCGKKLRQANTMEVAVKIINIIRGGNRSLTHRKFRDFLDEMDAAYGDLTLYSNVRWLSAGNCLKRFFALRKEIPIFLKEVVKSDTEKLEHQMQDPKFLSDLAFLTDMTSHLNDFNLKLQGRNQNIANLFGHCKGFIKKLQLFKSTFMNNNFTHFPSCKEHFEEMKNFEGTSFATHVELIDDIIREFETRYLEFENLEQDILLFSQPLNVNITNVKSDLQLELCDLQADPLLTNKCESGEDFFKLLPEGKYPKLRDIGLRMGSMLGSTYLCESTFSTMKFIKSKHRSSMTDKSLSNLLRLATTNINIDIAALVKEAELPQSSH